MEMTVAGLPYNATGVCERRTKPDNECVLCIIGGIARGWRLRGLGGTAPSMVGPFSFIGQRYFGSPERESRVILEFGPGQWRLPGELEEHKALRLSGSVPPVQNRTDYRRFESSQKSCAVLCSSVHINSSKFLRRSVFGKFYALKAFLPSELRNQLKDFL
jgi:hypothetical protein